MRRLASILAFVLLLGWEPGESPVWRPGAVSHAPTIVVSGGDADQHARLHAALARFREHGLRLPDLHVSFSEDKRRCGGALGRFDPTTVPWRISVCREVGFVITHELAHAWIRASVGPRTRARYLAERGLARWRDPDDPWSERGTEDAATVIHLSLLVRDPDPASPVWQERFRAYRLLTGRPAPGEPAGDRSHVGPASRRV